MRRYLEALEQHKPKRGRKRTVESIRRRLAAIESSAATASPMQRLRLAQERLDLTEELARATAGADLAKLEDEFVKAAKPYSEAKRISYTAWRELGVSAETLRKAGVPRTRRRSA